MRGVASMSINQMSCSSYWALQAPMHYYCRHKNSLRYVASGFFLFDLLLACPWGVILAQQSMVNIDTGGNRHSCKVFSSHPSWPVALRVLLVTVFQYEHQTNLHNDLCLSGSRRRCGKAGSYQIVGSQGLKKTTEQLLMLMYLPMYADTYARMFSQMYENY